MTRPSVRLDVGLATAASRLVEQSLGVVPGERVVLVYDEPHRAIAEAIEAAVREAKSEPVTFKLEDLGPRPFTSLDARVAAAARDAQATILLVDFHEGELEMRAEMVALASRHRLRHGHMVGVTRASVVSGFAVDPRRVADKTRELLVRLKPDSRITVKSAAGTDVVIELAPRCRWVEYGCVVGPGKAVNLPGGELITSPESVTGTYVADGTLGDAEGTLTRALGETPLTLHLVASRVRSIECPRDPGLARALARRVAAVRDLDRVGLVIFGVNLGLSTPVGDIASDQKIPGVHLALGQTFPEQTGAAWTSASWLGVTSVACDADIDSLPVLRGGRYML
jgi:leucyl aminopeptidase (aminopeptidase T)